MPDTKYKYQYTENFITALQWMWGDGYLAPGGPEEVAELLSDVKIKGSNVLDIGCGLGAISILLAENYGAKSVLGIDVEPHLIEHSRRRAEKSGLAETVQFELVDPGPLKFDSRSFNIVFSKDSIVHIPEKQAFYKDVLRVLKPGGVFVGSDWLRGGEKEYSPTAVEWLGFIHLDFQMQNLDQTKFAMEQAGFNHVRLIDRNEWYRIEVKKELAALSGDRLKQLMNKIGSHQAGYRLKSSQLKRKVIEEGFLRPTHFVGYKPL